jgi:outer membrane protein TolC
MNAALRLGYRTRAPDWQKVLTSRLHKIDSADFCYGLLFLIALMGLPVFAQSSSSPSSASGTTLANQVPLSGRSGVGGSVLATQSVTGTGGSSVDVISSTVNVSGQFDGSVPDGSKTALDLPLTLDLAISLGLRNNLGQVTETNGVLQARGQRIVSRSNLLPNVSSSLAESLERVNLDAQGLRSPSIPGVVGPYNFFDARAISLNQSIFDLVAIRNLRGATQNVHAAQDSATDARDLVILAVAGTYLQIVTTQARVVSIRALVESERAVFQQASDRLKTGVAALIDVTRTQVQYQTDVQLLRSELADIEKQKLNLARIVGLPLGNSYTLVDSFPYAPLENLTLEEALKRAFATRSDLRAAQASVLAAESALSAAHAEYLPSVSFHGDYGAVGTNPSQAASTYTLTGKINVPIFAGGRVQGDTEQAHAALNQRKAELQDLHGSIDHDVRFAFINLSSAADQVTVAESNVSLSHQTLKQSRDRFAAGVADTVEVVQAEQSVAQADADYINAVYEHNLAKVTLSRSMGQADTSLRQFLKGR